LNLTIPPVCLKCQWLHRDTCRWGKAPLDANNCAGFKPAPCCPQCGEVWDCCQCDGWQLRHFLYARPQMFWVAHYEFDPPWVVTGETDKVGGQQNQSAPGESIICIMAEIQVRLTACGEAGEALQDEAPEVVTIGQLSRPARRALNYCSGWKRRRQSYGDWKYQQERRCEMKGKSDLIEVAHA
jgi:hypothetical protein